MLRQQITIYVRESDWRYIIEFKKRYGITWADLLKAGIEQILWRQRKRGLDKRIVEGYNKGEKTLGGR